MNDKPPKKQTLCGKHLVKKDFIEDGVEPPLLIVDKNRWLGGDKKSIRAARPPSTNPRLTFTQVCFIIEV